jgi:hypothetical protein
MMVFDLGGNNTCIGLWQRECHGWKAVRWWVVTWVLAYTIWWDGYAIWVVVKVGKTGYHVGFGPTRLIHQPV